MDRNLILALTLSMAVLVTWSAWKARRQVPQRTREQLAVEAPGARSPLGPDLSSRPTQNDGDYTPSTAASSADPALGQTVSELPEWRRLFSRRLYDAELTSRGAALVRWTLKEYTESANEGEIPIELLSLQAPHSLALRTPFRELGLGDLGEAVYTTERSDAAGASFVLRRGGVSIRKSYAFSDDHYGLELEIEIANQSQRAIHPRFEVLWPAAVRTSPDFKEQSLVSLHGGTVARTLVARVGVPSLFARLAGKRDSGASVTTFEDGIEWAGVDDRYFVSVLVPDRPELAQVTFEPLVKGKIAGARLSFEPVELAPGQSVTRAFRGYLGPKVPELLEETGADLTQSINRGYFWSRPLAGFFEWLLCTCYAVVPNYGVCILILTLLVRGVTLPILSRQMRSTERMRELQPKLKEIQEEFQDDRARQSKATMALYREAGVNPMGGCLPMLLQMPIFIGLFYALRSSVELRHAPFALWITDLSAPEALFTIAGIGLSVRLLPLLMAGSMVLQQKVQPTPTGDPSQARMMQNVMPVMMTFLFYSFPSGLVLYYLTSNLLAVGHQLWLRHRLLAT